MLRTSVLLCVLFSAAPAWGQANDEEANRLFGEGRQLVREGKYAEACPKFEQAQSLRPGVGTLLNLGDCHERRGKTASALRTFEQALAMAEARGDKRASLARTRVEALEARLVKLTLVIPKIDGLEVTLDGQPFPRDRWGKPTPIDPGKHDISATAPGRTPFSKSVDAFQGAVRVSIRFPEDDEAATPAGAPMPAPGASIQADTTRLSTQRWIAVGAAGVGVVGLGIGAGFGLASLSAKGEADDHCKLGPRGDQCDRTGVDAGDSAIARGNVATVAFIVGGAAIAAGAVLWLTDAPKERAAGGVGLVPFGVRGQF